MKANTITRGVYNDTGSGLVTANAYVDFTGGTIENYAGSDMAVNDVNVRMLSTSGTPTVNVTGSNTITFNAGTVVSGVGSISKSGTGTLIFQGTNTHGGTIVNEGVVKVEGSGTFSSVGQLATNGSGIADVNGTNQTVGTLTGNGGKIINSVVATNTTLTVGGGDGGGGEYFGSIVGGSASPAGDYNMDGNVNAADYVVWRKTDNTPAGYNTWRQTSAPQAAPGGDITLVKTGLGAITVSGTNTYTGSTTIVAGALAFGTPQALYNNQQGSFAGFWNTTKIVVEADATLGFGVGGAGSFTEAQIANLHSSLGSASGGFEPGSSVGINPAVASYAYSTAIGDAAGGTIMTGLTKMGPNTLTLSNSNTYSGNTQVAEGVLSVTQIGNIVSGPGELGMPASSAQAAIRLGSSAGVTGTLRYTGAGETTDRDFVAWGGTGANGAIESSGSGALTLSGNLYSSNSGAKTLTLSGTNGGNNTVAGSIYDNADVLSMAKTGTGTWELSNANTYTGDTIVDGGTLKITGSHIGGGTSGYLVGRQAGLEGTIVIDNPVISPAISASYMSIGDASIANGGIGHVEQANGDITLSSYLAVANNDGTTGTYHQTGGSVFTTSTSTSRGVIVGWWGDGNYTMDGGSITSRSWITVGYGDGNTHSGTGTFTLNDGTILVNDDGTGGGAWGLGRTSTGNGTLVMNGGSITVNNDWFVVGISGHGEATLNDGAINTWRFEMSQNSTGSSKFTMNGGSVSVDGSVAIIGDTGPAEYTQTDGTFTVTTAGQRFSVGEAAGNSAIFNMTGGSIDVTDDWFIMGRYGTGTGTLSGTGSIYAGVDFVVAEMAGSNGTFSQQGGTITSGGWSVVGYSGSGQMTAGGTGQWFVGDNLNVGYVAGSTGVLTIKDNAYVNVQGNVPSYTGNVFIGDSGNGTLNMTGGTLDMTCGATGTNNSISYAVALADPSVAQDGKFVVGNYVEPVRLISWELPS